MDGKERQERRFNTSERFVAYSREVLENLKDDIANGSGIDPHLVERLEKTIRRHEPPTVPSSSDLADRIAQIKAFERDRQRF